MAALNIYGPSVVAAGQTLSYTDPPPPYPAIELNEPSVNPVLVLPQNVIEPVPSGPPHADSTLTILGSVSIFIDTNTFVTGIGEVNGASNSPSFLTIGAGGSFSIGSEGATAMGYFGEAPFRNDGSFSVYGFAGATGVQLEDGPGHFNSLSGFDNTGAFTVTAPGATGTGSATGVTNVRDHFFNSGTITVSAGDSNSSAVGVAYGTTVTNSGAITADRVALGINSPIALGAPLVSGVLPAMTITNTGVITAATAISFPSGVLPPIPVFVNGAVTTLTNPVFPILHLDNSGTINGDIVAGGWFNNPAESYAGSVIHNTGAINGKITLDSGGADTYDGRGGTLSGGITLGEGSDTIYLGNDGETVHGGSGGATVYGGSGADVITGGKGNDILSGGGGDDVLDGGGGMNTATYAGAYRQYAVGAGWATVSGGPEGGTDHLVHFQRLQFVDGYLAVSPTDTAGQVYRLYEAALGRAPDLTGLAGWVTALNAGTMSLQTVAAGFVGSAEFHSTYGSLTSTAFITLLYNTVLHRDPDAAGLTGWLGYMAQGHSQADVLLGFTESAEDINDLAAPVQQGLWIGDPNAAEAARLYDTTLGRLPDAGGLAGWTHTLDSGAMTLLQATQGFMNSAEFQAAYGALNDTAFITLLYNNTLHRDPDAGGLQGWLGYLGQGHTRAEVVLGFSDSAEHISNTAPHIDGGIWVI